MFPTPTRNAGARVMTIDEIETELEAIKKDLASIQNLFPPAPPSCEHHHDGKIGSAFNYDKFEEELHLLKMELLSMNELIKGHSGSPSNPNRVRPMSKGMNEEEIDREVNSAKNKLTEMELKFKHHRSRTVSSRNRERRGKILNEIESELQSIKKQLALIDHRFNNSL